MEDRSLSFRYLWLGQALANIGDILIIVGLMPLLYQSTHSAFVMALVPVIKTLSSVFSASLSPFIFNLFNLKHTLILSQAVKTITSIFLFLFLYSQWYETHIWIIFIFICIIGFFDGWTGPASKAIIPKIVEKHLILKSNSWMESINQTIEVAIWSIGAILVSLVNIYLPFLITFILYTFSFFILFKLNLYEDKVNVFQETQSKKEILFIGWNEIARRKDLKLLITVSLLITVADIIWLASFMYIYVEEVLGRGIEWWGYINSLLTGGILIASVIAYIKEYLLKVNFKLVLILTTLIMAVSTIVLSLNSLASIALICSFLYGVSSQLKGLLEVTYIQSNIDEDKLPYVYASQDVLNLLAFSIFTILLSIMIDFINVKVVFLIMGLLIFLSLFLILFYNVILRPIIKR